MTGVYRNLKDSNVWWRVWRNSPDYSADRESIFGASAPKPKPSPDDLVIVPLWHKLHNAHRSSNGTRPCTYSHTNAVCWCKVYMNIFIYCRLYISGQGCSLSSHLRTRLLEAGTSGFTHAAPPEHLRRVQTRAHAWPKLSVFTKPRWFTAVPEHLTAEHSNAAIRGPFLFQFTSDLGK